MSDFKIEKSVPIKASYRDKPCPYPFEGMEIGDSFHVVTEGAKALSERSKLNARVQKFRRKSGRRTFNVATRSTETGFRVWRVA